MENDKSIFYLIYLPYYTLIIRISVAVVVILTCYTWEMNTIFHFYFPFFVCSIILETIKIHFGINLPYKYIYFFICSILHSIDIVVAIITEIKRGIFCNFKKIGKFGKTRICKLSLLTIFLMRKYSYSFRFGGKAITIKCDDFSILFYCRTMKCYKFYVNTMDCNFKFDDY